MVPNSLLDFLYPGIMFAFESYQTYGVIFSLASLELFNFRLFEPVLSHLALGKCSFSRWVNLCSASLVQLHILTICSFTLSAGTSW